MLLSESEKAPPWKVYDRFADKPGYNENVTLFIVDKTEPARCTLEEFKEFAKSRKLNIPTMSHPGNGDGYSSKYVDSDAFGYRVLADFWNTVVLRSLPSATYDQALVIHGNSPPCFAHNFEPGGLHALGDPNRNLGMSYCRN